jgi:hypothetical protein
MNLAHVVELEEPGHDCRLLTYVHNLPGLLTLVEVGDSERACPGVWCGAELFLKIVSYWRTSLQWLGGVVVRPVIRGPLTE